MRENLVLTSAYARTYVRPSLQTLGDGEGSPKAIRPGEENVLFSWREIVRCCCATSAPKRLFDSVEVSNVRKLSNIYRWNRKSSKEHSDVFLVLGLHLCCRFCYVLGRYNAWVRNISQRSRRQIYRRTSAFLFFVSTTDGFCGSPITFSQKNLVDRAAINKQLCYENCLVLLRTLRNIP